MKLSSIRKTVETYDLDALRKAEENLLEEEQLKIEVEGEDEGEQLTHILAAIWVLEAMEKEGMDQKAALRAYTQRVRNSIS